MSEIENLNLLFADSQRQNFKDCNNFDPTIKRADASTSTSLKGFVQVLENKDNGEQEVVRESSNLIVYPGRVSMLCRAFGKDLDYSNGTQAVPYINMHKSFICYFGVGTGGAASNNNQNPLVVNSTDYQLGTHGTVAGATKQCTVNSRTYMGFDDSYPKFIPENEIINNSLILDAMRNNTISLNGATAKKRDTYLIANVQVTLGSDVANGTSGSQQISEAGLFLAPSEEYSGAWRNQSPYSAGHNLEMFARVTFPTITKNAQRSFTVAWYIFF